MATKTKAEAAPEPELTRAQKLCKLVNDAIGRNCTTTVDKIPPRGTRTTGIIALDLALGGGYPKRGIVEIWGPTASFKSTVVLHAMSVCQQAGGVVGRADVEQRDAHQRDLFDRTRIDVGEMMTCNCFSAEEYCEALATMIRGGADIVCLDSVGALSGLNWRERDQTKGDAVGGESKPMNRFSRVVNSAFCPEDIEDEATYPQATLILISHAYARIPTSPFDKGPKDTTSGGRTKDYLELQKIKIRRAESLTETVDGKQRETGVVIKFTINKNSIVPEEKDGSFRLLFLDEEAGLRVMPDNFATVFNTCCHHKMLTSAPKGWLWRNAAAAAGQDGQSVPIPGAKPTAERFIRENFRYCLRELFRYERILQPAFTPWDVPDVPDVIRVKEQEVPVGTDA